MYLKKLYQRAHFFKLLIFIAIVVVFIVNMVGLKVTMNEFSFGNLMKLQAKNPLIWLNYILIVGILFLANKLVAYLKQIKNKKSEINNYKESQNEYFHFIKELEKGNYSITFNNEDRDQIEDVLLNLRDRLVSNKEEEEKRKQEDFQRNWVSHGLAKFGDILRADNGNDLVEMSYTIISNLVKYLDANQGGLFILNDEKENNIEEGRFFELMATYAYDRRKFLEKRILWGEGLIGTCGLEKEPIYLTEIPNNYITITSGLGGANPKSLLLVPLKIEEEIYGIIEIASFNEIHEYQREFVYKIGESLASTISSIKINNRTSELLRKSQQQAEELASQEEELRQNMEEMQATQESLEQSQAKTRMIFENAMDAIITIDQYGNIDQFSPSAERLFGYSHAEVEGQNVKILMPSEYSKEHDGYLHKYKKTGQRNILGRSREAKGITKDGKIFPIDLRVEEASLNGKKMFVGMIRDITDVKKAQEEIQQQLEEIRSQDEEMRQNIEELQTTQEMIEEREAKIRMIFENALDAIVTINEHGTVDQFNPSAEKMFGYTLDEIIGENISLIMPSKVASKHDEYIKNYMKTGDKHIIGTVREETGKRKDGSEFPIEIRIQEAKLSGKKMFVGMLRDITDKKQKDRELIDQMNRLEEQEMVLNKNLNELQKAQEELVIKDKQQIEEIEKLNHENENKIKKIEKIKEDQLKKDKETKDLYESEINNMFDSWMRNLNACEKKTKK